MTPSDHRIGKAAGGRRGADPPASASAHVSPPKSGQREWAVAAAWGLLGVALLARCWRLAADGLWLDEAYTASLVRLPLGSMLAALRFDDAPALFYILARGVAALVGDSETALRLLPALCGGAAVAAAWAFCRRHAPEAALLSVAALGFSTLLVFYSRQARVYAVVHLLSVLLLWSAVSLRRTPSLRRAAAFAATSLLLLYSHNLGLLLVACGALAPLEMLRRPRERRLAAAALGALALGAVPWAVRLLGHVAFHSTTNQWMGAWWTQGRFLELAPLYSYALFANGAAPALRPPIPLPGLEGSAAPLAWLSWAVALAGVIAFLRGMRRSPDRDLRLLLLAFAALPLAGLVVVSRAVGPAYVLGRTDTLSLPAFLLLVAAGWAALPRKLSAGIAVLWIALSIPSLAPVWSASGRTAKGSDRALARALGTRVDAGDALVYAHLTRPSLEYHARRQGWLDRLGWTGTYPGSFDLIPAAVAPTPLDSASAWQAEALRLRERWADLGARRVWLLALRDPRAPIGSTSWPLRPATPPANRAEIDATRVAYPGNVLLSVLAGLRPVPVELEYRQDWVSGDRLLLRIDRERWVPLDSLPRVEAAP